MGGRTINKTRAVSPTVREMVRLADASGRTYVDICAGAGLTATAITDWKAGRAAPGILSVEDLLGELGYRLEIVPIHANVACNGTTM
jgi:hypothetical protein